MRREAGRTCLALLGCFLGLSGVAEASAGRPDRSFGKAGLVETRFGPSFLGTSFTSVEARPGDGVSVWRPEPTGQRGYWSYSPGGALQPEPGSPETPPLRATQADGKSIEVAWVPSSWPNTEFVIRRLQPDGQPDPTFGIGGEEPLPFFSQASGSSVRSPYPELLVPLPSGKLMVGGTVVFREVVELKSIFREIEVVLLRLGLDGQPDPTFGTDGVVRLHGDLGVADPRLGGLAPRQGEGLAVGTGGEHSSSLVGLTADGGLDLSFGSAGREPVIGWIAGVHATAGGKLLVAGTESGDFFVSRFEDDGQPDLSFGAGTGVVRSDFGGDDTVESVLWEEGGSILMGGANVTPPCRGLGLCHETPVLARVTADGQPAAGFGSAGQLRFDALTEPRRRGGVLALAPRPAGGVYAAGGSGITAFVAALDPGGAPVSGFGEDGILSSRFPRASRLSVDDVAVDRERGILVAGKTNSGGEEEAAEGGVVFRHRREGTLDLSYGDGAGFARVPEWPRRIVVDRRDRALVLGEGSIVRLGRSGKLDGSFGDEGLVLPRLPRPHELELNAIAALPNGRVVVAGTVGRFFSGERIVVFRFLADGSPDPAFGHHGRVVVPRLRRGLRAGAREVMVQADGRIVVAGYVVREFPSWQERRKMALARLLPSGDLDRSFGLRGWLLPAVSAESDATALASQGTRILVGGLELHRKRATEVLLRYRPDGTLDRGFGRGGKVRKVDAGALPSLDLDRLELLVSPHRLIAVCGGVTHPISAYRRDGRAIPGYGTRASLTPGRQRRGPVAALQGTRPVLAWTALPRNAKHPRRESTARLERLASP